MKPVRRQWRHAIVVLLPLLLTLPAILPAADTDSAAPRANERHTDDPALRVLFMGNSFSFYNNGIHTHFRNLLRATDDELVAANSVKMSTISGGRLEQQAPALGLLLDSYDWDAVVLQGHSREPIDPDRSAAFRQAAIDLSTRIRDAGARPVLFMTWAYRGRPEMTAELARAYDSAGAAAGAKVVPVGRAFARARETLPDLALHVADGKHPTLAGTYLAASVFHAALMGQPPDDIEYDAGLAPALARSLRRLAWETVRDSQGTSP